MPSIDHDGTRISIFNRSFSLFKGKWKCHCYRHFLGSESGALGLLHCFFQFSKKCSSFSGRNNKKSFFLQVKSWSKQRKTGSIHRKVSLWNILIDPICTRWTNWLFLNRWYLTACWLMHYRGHHQESSHFVSPRRIAILMKKNNMSLLLAGAGGGMAPSSKL